MDYHLANYLFHSETLYHFTDKTSKVSKKKEVLESEIIKKNDEKEIFEKEKIVKPQAVFETKNAVLILVNQISDAEKDFLGKILKAANLSFETVDLVELKNTQLPDYQVFMNQKITKTFLSFGVGLSKLHWNKVLTIYQTTTFDNINYLLADELSKIEANIDLKKALWANLQKLFPKQN